MKTATTVTEALQMVTPPRKGSIGMPPRLISVKEAAVYLSTTVPFIRTLIYRRELPFLKAGKKYVIDLVDLDKWVDRHRVPEEQGHA
jgi:excisionase family DNA binding protein